MSDTVTAKRSLGEMPRGPTRTFAVVIMAGPDQGTRFDLEAAEASRVLVGQGPACFVRLSDREVSRRHFALEPQGSRLRLVDLGSTNGTYVNSLAVADVLLAGGETIAVGRTVLRIEAIDVPASTTRAHSFNIGRFVGASEPIRRIYPLCMKLAAATIPVAIEGETGTGKEVLAEALHETGPRSSGPFVVFDCTAVAPTLMESTLFGHEKGAFTGAVSQKRGVFEQAEGGTLLIDEIGELDLSLQPKLLRAIQRSEIQRVGGEKWIKVDVRIIAATRRDLDREVQEGRFRDDLFYRLAVARIELPPLRKRPGDISLLTHHFWSTLGGGREGAPADLIARFEQYAWPGNVRELFNALSRRIALGELEQEMGRGGIGEVGLRGDDGDEGRNAASADPIDSLLALDLPYPRARDRMLEEFDRRYVNHVLEKYNGNVVRASAASGIARRYFQIIRARSAGSGGTGGR